MKISVDHTTLQGEISLPASKSISNRVLMIQSYCQDDFIIENLSDANDTVLLKKLLLLVKSEENEIDIDIEDAGTACRFILSFLAIQEYKTFILKGTDRMHLRPIGDLVDALVSIGASIEYLGAKGFLPLKINGKKILGGDVQIDASSSSQFVSSLCLLAPVLPLGLTILLRGEQVSETYVEMTLSVMKKFGIIYSTDQNKISIPSQQYKPHPITIENDWSSACFFYCMALMKNGSSLYFPFLQKESMQGDAYIQHIAAYFGLESFEENGGILIKSKKTNNSIPDNFDLTHHPDLAIPFIVFCATCYPSITLSGLHHLEYKESKRLTALTIELSKIGVELIYQNDILRFQQLAHFGKIKSISFTVYNDHRIAMALSMISLFDIEVEIDNSECVQKSFPHYWHEMKKIGFNTK